MKFTPKTEEQIALENLTKPGVYPFTVLEATDTVSKKSGNEMIKLKIAFFDDTGKERHVDDYLLASMEAKFRHFCVHAGMEGRYNDGDVQAEHCEGKEGYVKIGISKPQDGYNPKNEVKDYVAAPVKEGATRTDAERGKNPSLGLDDSDDDIKF